ncbi:hypothetical protein B0H21DRAFT_687382 [Amylocystis lapponica]|nr:hypothetical protein B0H21DRAFT_687382 [Amylocystis lapponica]
MPSHARSHSRNSSVSVPLSFPNRSSSISSTTANDSPPHSPTQSSQSASKRHSHHRRLSSVSTRRESADLMGVSLPSIPASASDNNINLGDKDSVRRRALWTLEGKSDVGAISVEIPELDTTQTASRPFEFPTKPSYPPGIGAGFGGGLNNMMGSKRDSLGSKRDSKFMASFAAKEQLHTLAEEEEEEEEVHQEPVPVVASPVEEPELTEPSVAVTITTSSPVRRRPATLNLRPLSLVSLASNGVIQATNDLPTPSPTPSSRRGLRSLTLASVSGLDSALSSNSAVVPVGSNKRQSLIMTQRRPSLNVATERPVSTPPQQTRRSSISYVCSGTPLQSVYGLPTPEMTPTSVDRRFSGSATEMDTARGRPLAAGDQHFLVQAHATLVQRITDLERALAYRPTGPRSRPLSYASDISGVSTLSEPSDEMLQLIADLKAERDELKRDVDGWRQRVGDLERQVGVLAKRVEAERRDAWVARERVGLLDIEKSTLEKALSEKTAAAREGWERYERAKEDAEKVARECERLQGEVKKMQDAEDECHRLRAALDEERKRREELERELEHAGLLATPRAFDSVVQSMPSMMSRTMMFAKSRGLGFKSIDSISSSTDVDSIDTPRDKFEFGLKAVEEEDEDDSRDETHSDYSDDELATYEEEEDGDAYAFNALSAASSLVSIANFGRSSPHLPLVPTEDTPGLTRSNSSSPTPLPSPTEPTHARHASLQKLWTFPKNIEPAPCFIREPEEIDHFFGCLEDMDNSPPLDSRLRSDESGKTLFSMVQNDDDDELPPFLLPADVGVEVASPEDMEPKRVLDVVVEEDEEIEESKDEDQFSADDEFVGEVDEGGIKFVFNPPPMSPPTPKSEKASPPPVMEPFDVDEEASLSFTFPQSRIPSLNSSPSSIPRSNSTKPISPAAMSTPVKSRLPQATQSPSAFMTPPSKRGGTLPSFIPQPRSQSGTPLKTPTTPLKGPSFIPQPRRVTSPASFKPSSIPVMSPPSRLHSKPLISVRI